MDFKFLSEPRCWLQYVHRERLIIYFFNGDKDDGLIFLMLYYNRDESYPGSLIIPVRMEAVILRILFY